MQNYKSVCAVDMICATLVNITYRHTDRQYFDKLVHCEPYIVENKVAPFLWLMMYESVSQLS